MHKMLRSNWKTGHDEINIFIAKITQVLQWLTAEVARKLIRSCDLPMILQSKWHFGILCMMLETNKFKFICLEITQKQINLPHPPPSRETFHHHRALLHSAGNKLKKEKNESKRKERKIKSIQSSVNPIIKRNIVILNEMWNQQLLMLIDPCFMWSRALKHLCAIFHFSTFPPLPLLLLRVSGDENKNKSSKPRPTIRDKTENVWNWIHERPHDDHGSQALTFWFTKSLLPRLCCCEAVWVWVELMNGSKVSFISPRLVSLITISHIALSKRSLATRLMKG